MDRRKRYVVSVVHIVGVGSKRHLIEIISQARALVQTAKFVHRIDKFFDICALVDAFVRIVGIRFAHFRIHHYFFHELVHGHSLTFQNPALYHLAEIFKLLFGCARKAEQIQIKQGVIDGRFVFKCVILQRFHRFRTDPALGEIDNARRRFAIERVIDKP